jgi:prevent-host-death family protein
MQKLIPISDLQRQAGTIVGDLTSNNEPVIITQRGRASAVLLSAAHYTQIEADLTRLDELELLSMVAQAREAIAQKKTISHREVKARFTPPVSAKKKK